RLGTPPSEVEDALQRVFLVAADKLDAVLPGHERSFLLGTALRVASDMRRHAQRRERLEATASEAIADLAEPASQAPDELLDSKRARELLDRVLDAMPLELRAVFVLFEFEGLSVDEMAELLELPRGTAASRLRRARDEFHAQARRVRATRPRAGGGER